MRARSLCALLTLPVAVFLSAAGTAQAQMKRPKIGLALSGGGAKGCAHVGVLRQLEKMHIPVDYIAGTSMGAVIGALYASGMTPDEIEKALAEIDWEEVLSDATAFNKLTYRRKWEETRYPSTVEVGLKDGKIARGAGIRTGQKLSFLLSSFLLPQLDQRDFNKLPIPYAAVATDLETGDPFVIRKGDLAEAVRASMSIPGAFTPVNWEDGKILVDGGVTMNVPVSVVREMGADIVIAVDIASPLGKRDTLNTTLGVVGQLSSFLTRKNMEPELAKADVVLSPDITGFDTFSFSKSKEIVKRGDDEAIRKKDELIKYAQNPAQVDAMIAARHVPRGRDITIDEIKVVGLNFVDERFVRTQMDTKAGDKLDMKKLQKDIEWMYGWNDFIGISAGLATSNGKHTLIIRVQEKPWGPAYIRTGIGMDTRYNKPGVFLLLNYTRRWINERGGEWRNDLEFGTDWALTTEWYQPRGYDKFGFFSTSASYERRSIRVFQDVQPIGDYDVKQLMLRLEGGTQMYTNGEVRLGLFQRFDNASVEVGLPGFPGIRESEAGLRGEVDVNTTNEPFFPVKGSRITLVGLAPFTSLGAKEQYVAGDLRSTTFASWGRHVFTAGLALHDVDNPNAPLYDQALIGGAANLSGYPFGSLVGQAGMVVSLGYRNRITRIPGLSKGIYAGILGEAGNVYSSLSDVDFGHLKTSGTLYFGLDTSYGPLVFAIAKSPHIDMQYYLQIGRSF